jgi:hypothetical protein
LFQYPTPGFSNKEPFEVTPFIRRHLHPLARTGSHEKRQEKRYIMAGRSYQNFYDGKKVSSDNKVRLDMNPQDYDDKEALEVLQDYSYYDEAGYILSNMRRIVKVNGDISEEIKERIKNCPNVKIAKDFMKIVI